MEEQYRPLEREELGFSPPMPETLDRLSVLREKVGFAQHVAEHIRNNQELVLREFHDGFRRRLKPLELILGTKGVADILSALADINELRPQLYPVYRSTMEEAAAEEINELFADEGVNLRGKEAIARLITGWEYWKKQRNGPQDGFADFLRERKEGSPKAAGPWEVEDIVGELPGVFFNEEYAQKGHERAGRDAIEGVLGDIAVSDLLRLAQNGTVTREGRLKLHSFREAYAKRLPPGQRDGFLRMWEDLVSIESLRWYGRQQLAYVLGVNSADVVVVNDESLARKSGGRRPRVLVSGGVRGGFTVRRGAEVKAFDIDAIHDAVRFLHGA